MPSIGTIKVSVSDVHVAAVGSLITVAGANYDARTGRQLIVPSANLSVQFCVKERVIDRSTGSVRTIPLDDHWNYLFPNEYEMTEELQPADKTSTVPWTFRFQPTRERLPLFSEIGIYELWFKFTTPNNYEDDIRLTFLVRVGETAAPRRVESVE